MVRPTNGGFMKTVLLSLILVLSSVFSTTVFAALPREQDKAYFQFDRPTIEEVVTGPLAAFKPLQSNFADCNTTELNVSEAGLDPLNPIDNAHIWLDKIINIGKKAWSVIELGRPVVNVKVDVANALPQGIKCWSHLAGWAAPQSKTYKVSYVNGFNYEVVSFAFRVIYTTGGNYNGVGRYITNATVVPAQLNVAWGYTFNASTVIPSVFNSGSVAQPVAGMQLNLNWSVNTVMKHSQQSESFYVGGDGAFKRLN